MIYLSRERYEGDPEEASRQQQEGALHQREGIRNFPISFIRKILFFVNNL